MLSNHSFLNLFKACATKPAPSKNIQVREMILNGMTGTLGRGDTYQLELFKRGVKIWIKDVERVWTCAELLQDLSFDSSTVLVKRLSDNEVWKHTRQLISLFSRKSSTKLLKMGSLFCAIQTSYWAKMISHTCLVYQSPKF